MFTGLIEEIGVLKDKKKSVNQFIVRIECFKVLEDVKIGDSIALNGMCVTITKRGNDYFEADITPESIKMSSLAGISVGSKVNLERALKLSDRLDGHIVNGHIDGIGKIENIRMEGNSYIYSFSVDKLLSKYIVDKGSISIDGTSLTVATSKKNHFSVSLIPVTLNKTVLKYKKTGDIVNIECDILGKYIEKLFYCKNEVNSNITMDLLSDNGFL